MQCICRKSFHLLHFNAESIPSHFDELMEMVQSLNVVIIAIAEFCLKSEINSSIFQINGCIFRANRKRKDGGWWYQNVHPK